MCPRRLNFCMPQTALSKPAEAYPPQTVLDSPSGMSRSTKKVAWWRQAVFYEIAPISFQDSNGDGKGDLPGLIGRIDYLDWLGIDAVWLTPIFPSPMRDLGYDISDFCSVDPLY